jgi:putative peptide zinc metalloprotease protein
LESVDPNIWERGPAARNLAVLERIREERRDRLDASSLLYLYFSAWNPDRVLTRIHPYLRWLFTRGFVIVSLFLFMATAVIVASDWSRIRQDTIEFYSFAHKTAYDLLVFWILLFVVSGVHEFGHGLTCKHFGGEVRQMGLMLIYFTPAFFTDTTDMYIFDRSSKRLWTIFAGMWIELVMCGIATLVWYFSPPGSFWGDIGYKTLLLTGVSGVFFNMNPLMKFDGYYGLSQYLEVDNLREDSFEYVSLWFRRFILRQDVDLPAASRRKRRIYLIYGISAMAYSGLVIYIFTVFVKNVFLRAFGDWGYPATALAVYLVLRRRLLAAWPTIRSGLRAAKETLMNWKLTRGQWVGVTAAIAVLTLPPTRTRVTSEFVLEPATRAEVRAAVPGVIREVRVREGQSVALGEVLAQLGNASVEERVKVFDRECLLAAHGLLAARSRDDRGETQRFTKEYERLRFDLATAEEGRAALKLRAPVAGVVTTPEVEQRIGEYIAEGQLFAVVADRSSLRARVFVRDWELEDVKEGAPVQLNLLANPLHTYTGHVRQILPASAPDQPVYEPKKLERYGQELSNYFAVVLEFPNPGGALREGLTGTAKIEGRRRPLVWHFARNSWRWLRSQVW